MILTASAAFVYPDLTLHPDFTENRAQTDRSETTINEIKSSASIITRVQPPDPLKILTAGAVGTGSGTEVTVYSYTTYRFDLKKSNSRVDLAMHFHCQ